jgi:23S rRNA (uracil1939-C5)-methyltransferase
MELLIEKLVYGGDALARDAGKVVLLPFALPGERVVATPVSSRKDLLRARLSHLLDPSPHRVSPPCPHFLVCGGCSYQHAAYPFQVQQKIAILRDVLARLGKIPAPASIAAVTGPEWEYRNRIQLHCDGRRLGFHQPGSRNVVAVDRCPIASPALNRAIASLNTLSRSRRWPDFLRSFELFTNEQQVLFNVLDSGARRLSRSFFEWINSEIPGALDSSLLYDGFRVSHRSFFQVNRFLVQPLVDLAIPPLNGDSCLDLYAGVGLFSRALLSRFRRVVAVEATQSAVADLIANVPQVEAVRQNVEDYLETLTAPPNYVIADPPRAGLGPKVTAQLLRLRPPRLTIVSCDPATLARDLAALATAYAIETITLIDLFPHTASLESVTQLTLLG